MPFLLTLLTMVEGRKEAERKHTRSTVDGQGRPSMDGEACVKSEPLTEPSNSAHAFALCRLAYFTHAPRPRQSCTQDPKVVHAGSSGSPALARL